MSYEIIWSKDAGKQLSKLDRTVSKRIFRAVDKLKEGPYRDLREIVGTSWYRLRVGDYRVIVEIERGQLRVLVLKVGHRKNAYQQL